MMQRCAVLYVIRIRFLLDPVLMLVVHDAVHDVTSDVSRADDFIICLTPGDR